MSQGTDPIDYRNDDDQEPPPPPPPPPQGNVIVEKRRPERITVPFYVVERYGAQLKPYGLAVYLALCYHVSRKRVAWPSYGTIAREVGCSRSMVERSMRLLKELGLVVVQPRFEGARQTSNVIYLVDPGTRPEDVLEGGAVPQHPPASPRRPPVPPTAPAPADRQGGRRPIDGAEADPEEVVPKEGENTPPESAQDSAENALLLTQLWLRQVVCEHPGQRAKHRQEASAEIVELLRRGFSFATLEESILDEERDRTEYPRFWRDRVKRFGKPPKDYQAITAQRREDDERGQRDAEDLRARVGGRVSINELFERRRRGEDTRALLVGDAGQMPTE